MSTHPDPEQLSAYVDGELPDHERDDLEQHLTGCSDCSATLRALRATLADMRAMPAPVPSEQESWALRAAINKARKRPAARYRRWTIAAGSVAAVAAAIVVFVNVGQTSNSTFGRTSTASAPLAGTGGTSQAALIEVDPRNYTPATASQLVIHGPVLAAPQAVAPGAVSPSPTSRGGVTSRTAGSTGAGSSFESAVTDAQRASYLTGIQRCEQQVLPTNTSNRPVPLRYIVGTFEGTPVFFLLYSVTSGSETKLELWVVRRTDCYIRYFVPPQ